MTIRMVVCVVIFCITGNFVFAGDVKRSRVDVPSDGAWLQSSSADLSRVYVIDRFGKLTEIAVSTSGYEVSKQSQVPMRGNVRGLIVNGRIIVVSDHTGMLYRADHLTHCVIDSICYPMFHCKSQEEAAYVKKVKERIRIDTMRSEGGFRVAGVFNARSVNDTVIQLQMGDDSLFDWNTRTHTIQTKALSHGSELLDRVGIVDSMDRVSFSGGAVFCESLVSPERLCHATGVDQHFIENPVKSQLVLRNRLRDGQLMWSRDCAAVAVLHAEISSFVALSPDLSGLCILDMSIGVTNKTIGIPTCDRELPEAKSIVATSTSGKRIVVLRASTDIIVIDTEQGAIVDQYPIDWDTAYFTRRITLSDEGDVFLEQPEKHRVTCLFHKVGE